MIRTVVQTLVPLTVLQVWGCAPVYSPAHDSSLLGEEGSRTYVEGSPDAEAVLDAANTLTFDVLDIDVGLDRRAAEGIVELRPFSTIEALDAVPYVGGSAMDKLFDYAPEQPQAITVHGVPEQSDLAHTLLHVAHLYTLTELDDDLGLDSRAAQGIVDGRPFLDLSALDAVAYVGPTAFSILEAAALSATICEDGEIYGSDGQRYEAGDLEAAIAAAPDDGIVELCPGVHGLEDLSDRPLTLVGFSQPDDVVLDVFGGLSVVAHLDVDRLTLSATDVTVGQYGNADSAWLTARNVVLEGGVSVQQSGGLVLSDGSTLSDPISTNGGFIRLYDVVLDGEALGATLWPVQIYDGSLTMQGGGVIRSRGIRVSGYSTVVLLEVDLGDSEWDNEDDLFFPQTYESRSGYGAQSTVTCSSYGIDRNATCN